MAVWLIYYQFVLVCLEFHCPLNLNNQKNEDIISFDKKKLSRFGGSTEDRWRSVEEIATYLGIKRDTVYRWITEKQMPAHRMGRLWKFKRDEVDDWVRKSGASEEKGGGAPVAS